MAGLGSLLHAYLLARIASVIGALASLTSSHFLFINGNGEKRACESIGQRGQEKKTFPTKVKITIFAQFVDPTDPSFARGVAGSSFWRQKGKKSGEIQFDFSLPLRSFFFASLSSTCGSLSSFVSLLYGQIRLPAVGIITEWERRRRRLLHLTFAFSVLSFVSE